MEGSRKLELVEDRCPLIGPLRNIEQIEGLAPSDSQGRRVGAGMH
jgi:hypothetical protein